MRAPPQVSASVRGGSDETRGGGGAEGEFRLGEHAAEPLSTNLVRSPSSRERQFVSGFVRRRRCYNPLQFSGAREPKSAVPGSIAGMARRASEAGAPLVESPANHPLFPLSTDGFQPQSRRAGFRLRLRLRRTCVCLPGVAQRSRVSPPILLKRRARARPTRNRKSSAVHRTQEHKMERRRGAAISVRVCTSDEIALTPRPRARRRAAKNPRPACARGFFV